MSPLRMRARRRGRARGFSLPELLAVVIMIGILAATASPTFINVMRDRRVNRAAMQVTGLYRLARSRALGRGTAVLVRWDGAARRFEMREAVVTSPSGSLIASSCLNIASWTDPVETRAVTELGIGAFTYELAALEFLDPDPPYTARTDADVCFTPRGRTFYRPATSGAFTPLVGVPRVNIRNTATNVLRTVFIPPNGVARMKL